MQVVNLVTYFPLCSLFFKRGMDTLGKKTKIHYGKKYTFWTGAFQRPQRLTAENPDCSFIKYFMFLTENEVYVGY